MVTGERVPSFRDPWHQGRTAGIDASGHRRTRARSTRPVAGRTARRRRAGSTYRDEGGRGEHIRDLSGQASSMSFRASRLPTATVASWRSVARPAPVGSLDPDRRSDRPPPPRGRHTPRTRTPAWPPRTSRRSSPCRHARPAIIRNMGRARRSMRPLSGRPGTSVPLRPRCRERETGRCAEELARDRDDPGRPPADSWPSPARRPRRRSRRELRASELISTAVDDAIADAATRPVHGCRRRRVAPDRGRRAIADLDAPSRAPIRLDRIEAASHRDRHRVHPRRPSPSPGR